MMKIKSLLTLAVCAMIVSCGGDEKKENAENKAAQKPIEVKNLPAGTIAYVDMDSLQRNYQLYIDLSNAAEVQIKSLQNQIAQKENQIQNLQTEAEKKIKADTYTQEQYDADQKKMVRYQQEYAQLQQNATTQVAQIQAESLKTMQDSLSNFLADYNKGKKYSYILPKESLLYGNPSFDITAEVIAGLNSRYKK